MALQLVLIVRELFDRSSRERAEALDINPTANGQALRDDRNPSHSLLYQSLV
jgi:hypothetical protein